MKNDRGIPSGDQTQSADETLNGGRHQNDHGPQNDAQPGDLD